MTKALTPNSSGIGPDTADGPNSDYLNDTARLKQEHEQLRTTLEGLLATIDRVLFNKPTRADYAKINAAHELARALAPPREDQNEPAISKD